MKRKRGRKGGKGSRNGPRSAAPVPSYLGLTPRWWLAVGLILAFVGVNLQLLTHIEAARWFGIGLILIGVSKAVYWTTVINRLELEREAPRKKGRRAPERDDLAYRFLRAVTLKWRLKGWLPVAGILVIIIDLAWNLLYARSSEFLSQDWTLWALGVLLLLYPFIPESYGKERDFSLLLIILFTLTMVVPMGLYRLATGTTDLPGGFVYWMLGVPVAGLVNLTGAWALAHGIYIDYQTTGGQFGTLGISTGCAGLDSLFLFISGFVAFILVENPRLDRRLAAALVLGILTAYFANLLRMAVIVGAGIHWGHDAMMAVHENAGTLIFLAWIALFWYLMYRFVLRPGARASASAEPRAGGDLRCSSCGLEVDPEKIPGKCPDCGQAFDPGLYCESCGREVDPEAIPEKCPKCGNPFGR